MAVINSEDYCTTINDEKLCLLKNDTATKRKPAKGRCVNYKFNWFINNKGATMVLILVTLVHIFDPTVVLSTIGLAKILKNDATMFAIYSGCSIVFYLFYPIIGLYADIKFGRYKTGIVALCMSLCAVLMVIVGLIIFEYASGIFASVIFSIGYILGSFVRTSFKIVMLSFGVDQMIGASSEELSAFTQWYYFCFIIGWVVTDLIVCSSKTGNFIAGMFSFSGAHVCCILMALFLLVTLKSRSCLITEPQIKTNPISLIFNILKYAKTNKYPKNRSAFTYWEDNYPSRLDFAKQKYGGPFTEEQVQDFKILLRIVPLLVCMLVFFIMADGYSFLPHPNKDEFSDCLKSSVYFINGAILIATMLVNQIVLRPLIHKRYPSMLQKIGFGIFVCVLAEGSILFLDVISPKTTKPCILSNIDNTTYSYWSINDSFVMVPKVITGFGFGIVAPTTLEFAFAQAPYSMRGVIVGVWFMATGFMKTFGFSLMYPFEKIRNGTKSLPCEFYVFGTKFIIIGMSFFCFLLLSSCYKLRLRGDQFDLHQTVKKYYSKYLDYNEDQNSTNTSSIDCDSRLYIEVEEPPMNNKGLKDLTS